MSVDLFHVTFIENILMRNNSCKFDWYYEYNFQEVNSTKTLSKYTFTHKLCSVILRNVHLFWTTKTPKWSAMTDDIYICLVGNVLYHTYIKLKNTFLFFNNYFNMLQNFLQCVTHYKDCRKISKYLYSIQFNSIQFVYFAN